MLYNWPTSSDTYLRIATESGIVTTAFSNNLQGVLPDGSGLQIYAERFANWSVLNNDSMVGWKAEVLKFWTTEQLY